MHKRFGPGYVLIPKVSLDTVARGPAVAKRDKSLDALRIKKSGHGIFKINAREGEIYEKDLDMVTAAVAAMVLAAAHAWAQRSVYLPMITWGISAMSHDAALAVFDHGRLVFASESERFSGVKNDPEIDHRLIDHARQWGEPDQVVWYERAGLKTLRQLRAGQGFDWRGNDPRRYLRDRGITAPLESQGHHHSHAAAGYFTSGWDQACVLVIDAIGEFDTLTIWSARGQDLRLRHRRIYPQSVGLWYSAMTQRCGLRANEEEYILMGMAALGDPDRLYADICRELFDPTTARCRQNFHRGCRQWRPDLVSEQDHFDIAAATQRIYEEALDQILALARVRTQQRDLVFMGGCALNCRANALCLRHFDRVWIMPAPGDSGSAIGAVLASTHRPIDWPGPFLGLDMGYHAPDQDIVEHLLQHQICGLARGRAEFGPRALGNRSLLADPRGADIRDRVNDIKHRQRFRPFAPAILSEHAAEYFDIPQGLESPYMQMTWQCRRPDLYPAIVHHDGTSRVQTVAPGSGRFRSLLEQWYQATGCPMLLNTSLNIRGRPMVNDARDAARWQRRYGVRVFT